MADAQDADLDSGEHQAELEDATEHEPYADAEQYVAVPLTLVNDAAREMEARAGRIHSRQNSDAAQAASIIRDGLRRAQADEFGETRPVEAGALSEAAAALREFGMMQDQSFENIDRADRLFELAETFEAAVDGSPDAVPAHDNDHVYTPDTE